MTAQELPLTSSGGAASAAALHSRCCVEEAGKHTWSSHTEFMCKRLVKSEGQLGLYLLQFCDSDFLSSNMSALTSDEMVP